jgi:hypothetical protein
MGTRRKYKNTNNAPSGHPADRTNHDTEQAQHAATLLSDNRLSGESWDDAAWSEMTLLSFADDDTDSQPPRPRSLAREDSPLRPLDAYKLCADRNRDNLPAPVCSTSRTENCQGDRRSRRVTRDILYGSKRSAHKLRVDNSPHADETYSVPRAVLLELPQPPSLIGQAFQSVHHIVKTGVRNSLESLGTLPRKPTLRRFWGALKETLDELGDGWDGHDGDKEHEETLDPGVDRMRSVSASVTPAKQSSRESITPQTRLLLGSVKSRPSHYNTLRHSPVADSRSSKWKRKSRLRYKSPTPVRRNHESHIDPSYSTEDESNDPHSRLLNKLLAQDPSCFPQDDFYVFIYKQDSRTGSFDPGSENSKPNANRRESTLPDVAEAPPVRSRAPVANALEFSAGRLGRQSVANLITGECQHGNVPSQQTCELSNEAESSSVQSSLAQNRSTPLIPQSDVDSRTGLLMGGSEAMASSGVEMPNDLRRIDRVSTPNNLREDVGAIFYGHANGNKAVDRQGRSSEKLKFTERIKEALRPQHPDLLKYKPEAAKRSDAEPPTNSNFHMSDDGRVHRVVEHPPTRSSDLERDAGRQLTKEFTSELPTVGRGVDEWLARIEPQDDAPDDLSSTGPVPPEPASPPLEPSSSIPAVEVTPQHKKAKRRARLLEPCTVMSVVIPPERDLTDLLQTPFLTFQQMFTKEYSGPSDARPGETLMLAFGVSYDIEVEGRYYHPLGRASEQSSANLHLRPKSVTSGEDLLSEPNVSCISTAAQHNFTGSISVADDAMSQSAAMGSLSMLSHIDGTAEQKTAEVRRVKYDTAHAENTSWSELDGVNEMTFCVDPPVNLSHKHCEYQAIHPYNLYSMFQGVASRTPLLTIWQWLSMDPWNHRLQSFLKDV